MLLRIALLLLIGGLQGKPSSCDSLQIKDSFVTWGHERITRSGRIEAIIIHSSYNRLSSDSFSINGILDEYRQINVSPHYIIDRDGTIYRLVSDQEVAYHAGKSRLPDGRTNVNALSIGIEIINTEKGFPSEAQYRSLVDLIKCLKTKYPIKYTLGHSDISPGRKSDPWNFDWEKFYQPLKEH